nr:hypothetical protein L203_04109 [Cryptococcus depauperatus CBS 7841]
MATPVYHLQDPTILNEYAPIFKLSKGEQYFPSGVEYMLPHYSYASAYSFAQSTQSQNHSLLTLRHLDELSLSGMSWFLSIVELHNPQRFLYEQSVYLFGLAGQKDGMKYGVDGRGRVEEPVYGFRMDQDKGIVVDLWYWTPLICDKFYPFNFGKPARRFGILGNYVADWKHFRMYLVNDNPVSRDLVTTHQGGQLSARTVRWKDIEKMNGRPVVYVAQGNHRNWPQPGDHLANLFKIIDKTDDEGPVWNINDRVITTQYWKNHQSPNRKFRGPPKCLIATVSTESDYTFRVRSPVMNWAMDHGFSQYKLSRDDDQDMYDRNVQLASTKGSTVFRGIEKHSVRCRLSVSAPFLTHRLVDDFARNTVRGYKISLCLYNGQYLTTSGERPVCAYGPGKKGFKTASAVSLDDIDDWRWSY